MEDIEKQVEETYYQIRYVMKPVLDRVEPLLFDLGMQISDSETLGIRGIGEFVDDVLRNWARTLVNPFGTEYAKYAGQNIVRLAFEDKPPAEFWRTDLGQKIADIDGFPERSASRTEAAAVLGITRQAVSQAMEAGRLRHDRADDDRVARASLMRQYRLRKSHRELMAKEE